MILSRDITWEGFFNARDLGGLSTRDGRRTRQGAFVRSADPRFVTTTGWQAAYDAGMRTIIDLRNADEIRSDAGQRQSTLAGSAHFAPAEDGASAPPGMERVEVPLDDNDDTAFWQYLNEQRLNGTPLYYRPFLERKADRCAAVITAIAHAAPRGVLFHCAVGRDRTGLVALLLLALVHVEPEAIAADYEASTQPVKALLEAMNWADQGPMIEQTLSERGTTAREAIFATLDALDIEKYLLTAGVSAVDLAVVTRRLV